MTYRSHIFTPPEPDDPYYVAITFGPGHVWYDSPAVTEPFCITRETADKVILALEGMGFVRVP